jgi:hypothetical protein
VKVTPCERDCYINVQGTSITGATGCVNLEWCDRLGYIYIHKFEVMSVRLHSSSSADQLKIFHNDNSSTLNTV